MVPRGSPCLGHVALLHLPIKCRVSKIYMPTYVKSKLATSAYANSSLTHHLPCVIHTLPCQYVQTVWTIQSAFFFVVGKIEKNAICHSFDVPLTPFEVCWVHNDKGYALVHFEVILDTFIFGLNFDPWSRF
jgi:hypothetical protein